MSINRAGVFLHNGRKVLLVHQKESNMWSLPKGGKEENECNEDCWKRELFEETGIQELPPHKITANIDLLKYNITIVELFTDYTPIPKISSDNDEIDEVKWIDMKDAIKLNMNAVTKNILRKYLPQDPFQNFRSCRKNTTLPASRINEFCMIRNRRK